MATAFTMIGDALEELASESNAKRMIMAIDELPIFLSRHLQDGGEDAKMLAERRTAIAALLYALRALRQRDQTPVFWLHCGSIGLESFVERIKLTHTLAGLQLYSLEAFNAEHTRTMLQRLWQGKNLPGTMPAAAIEHMIARIDWLIPSFTQQLFHLLCQQKASWVVANQPSAQDVDRAYDKLLSAEQRTYFLHWDSRLEEQLGKISAVRARIILNAICATKRKLSRTSLLNIIASKQSQIAPEILDAEVRYLLGALERDGYITQTDGRYVFRSPLLRDYWQKYCLPIKYK